MDAPRTVRGPVWTAPEPSQPGAGRLERLADDFLRRCRGHGPANCVARCPLHVDAHGYMQLTRLGRFREALQLIRETVPFPGILGYVCVHPCELHCKRIDTDEAIRVRDVKRFLAEWEPGDPEHVLDREREREHRVAVVGAGPAGLLAAHDLRRRGYRVTLFERESRIGGCLTYRIPPWRLPATVRDRDLSIIDALGVRVRAGVEVGADVSLKTLCDDHHAVILTLGFSGIRRLIGREILGIGIRDRGTVPVDPLTGETAIDGVFAGGDAVTGPGSVVHSLAEGRRVAESAHRFLIGGQPSRDREPRAPRALLWQLEVDEEERRRRERPPVMLRPAPAPLTEAEAVQEGERCLDCVCGLCTEQCDFLAKHCDVPRELAVKVRDGPGGQLETVYSCTLCGLCREVCPVDLDTGAMMLEARYEAVRRGLGPLHRHRRELRFFRFGISSAFCLAMAEPGRRTSRRVFFTGCSLPATAPDVTFRLYHELRRRYPGTGLLMHCCGSPAEALGMADEARAARLGVAAAVERLGAEELVVACPKCRDSLASGEAGVTIRSVWSLLADELEGSERRHGWNVSVHDPCAARGDGEVRSAVRRLVASTGAELNEVEWSGVSSRCCGLGGRIADVDPRLSRAMARRRAAELDGPVVTYCSRCQLALSGAGANVVHVAEFLFADPAETAPRRVARGSLRRYVNRLLVKRRFLRLAAVGSDGWS